MSSEEEIGKSLGSDSDPFHESQKGSKIAYHRDFLLALSGRGKTLPSDLDSSLLSEFGDGLFATHEQRRNHRRIEYSSSPPTTGDSSNYSRGVYGRWDNRSTIRSERDNNDTQLSKDSDSGHAFGNQFRKPSRSSEHDGLLGSGTFARPPGFSSGFAGLKGRPNDPYPPKKISEPYQPPRPYKAGPLSRREVTDSLNDETFGSSDRASQDQAEEERRRRESFELMRKEQLKSLQEKQNSTTSKFRKDHTSFDELVGESGSGNRNLDESATQSLAVNDLSKSSLKTTKVKLLVPPGFKSTIAGKNLSTTSIVPSRELEARIPYVEDKVSHSKTITQDGFFSNQEERLLVSKVGPGERDANVHTIGKGTEPILDKLFASVISDNLYDSSDLRQVAKENDPQCQANIIQSSKFAQWFSTDEKKTTEENEFRATDMKLPQEIRSDVPFPGSVIKDGYLTSDTIPSSAGLPKNVHKKISKEDTAPPILTCEDLEQTILSGYSGSSSTLQPALQVQKIFGSEKPKAEADDGASQHLLSLLQKGPIIKDTVVPPTKESEFSGEKVEGLGQPGKSVTLETLFGSAFMKELQSAEAPVSALGSAAKIEESNRQQQSKSDNFRSLFEMYDAQVVADSSKQQIDILSKHGGFDGVGGDPFGNLISGESQYFKNERPLIHNRHGSLDHEVPFHNLQAQSQMNHARPFLHQLEPHSPMMTQHGGSMNHQLPPKMVQQPPFHYPSGGQTGFEPPHPILQQIQMQRTTPNNLTQHVQEFNRGAPFPANPRARGSMQAFTFNQSNFSGPGLAMQGSGGGGNHPEALQKLLEMELRANSSSNRMMNRPFGSLGNNNSTTPWP